MSKRKTNGKPRPVMVIAAVAVVAFVCVASLGYLWQQTEIHTLGRKMRNLEIELEELQKTNERLSRGYAEMCSPRALDLRVRQLQLGLAAPQPDQIIRMQEPVREQTKSWAAREPHERGY